MELKKCPLCGGNATLCKPPLYHSFRVACVKCRCNTGGYKTENEAVSAWNRRVANE